MYDNDDNAARIVPHLCNTVADPVLYALRRDEFRKGFKDTFRQLQSVSILCSGQQDPANVETGPSVEVEGIDLCRGCQGQSLQHSKAEWAQGNSLPCSCG